MIVRFESSETGEVLMFAETAKVLLDLIGKDTTARGTFTRDQMPQAAEKLREAVKRAAMPAEEEDEEETGKRKEPVVSLSQRAWPLIDMLERTGSSGKDAYIVWEAPADF